MTTMGFPCFFVGILFFGIRQGQNSIMCKYGVQMSSGKFSRDVIFLRIQQGCMPSGLKTKNGAEMNSERTGRQGKQTGKTRGIRKKSLKKKSIKQSPNFYQRSLKERPQQSIHVLNLYNILSINQRAIKNPHHEESLIRSMFYYKNIKKIEIKERYLVFWMNQNHALATSVSLAIGRYKIEEDERMRTVGELIEGIDRRIKFTVPESIRSGSHLVEVMDMLDSLGDAPFLSKISSNKLAISRSMIDMFGYDSEDFIIQCLRYKTPLLEPFSSEAYFQLTVKMLENLELLLELLEGRIPLCTYLQLTQFQYCERIRSKNNVEYRCRMKMTMPIPQVTLMRVEEILQTKELNSDSSSVLPKEFKQYCSEVREKQLETLQYLIELPVNALPENRYKVADYIERSITDQDISKSVLTQ